MRLDPKLRYLAELAARKQRRSLSSYIEWAVEESLKDVKLHEGTGYNGDESISVADVTAVLWDVDAADRFAKLALRFPELLTHDEQVLWKLVRENGYFWKGRRSGPDKQWTWTVEESALVFSRLREKWTTLMEVAADKLSPDVTVSWVDESPKAVAQGKNTSGFEDIDDEIPF